MSTRTQALMKQIAAVARRKGLPCIIAESDLELGKKRDAQKEALWKKEHERTKN